MIPTDYDLLLHPDLTPGDSEDSGGFSGNVKIKLDVHVATQEIILHSHELNITDVTFTSPDVNIRVLVF